MRDHGLFAATSVGSTYISYVGNVGVLLVCEELLGFRVGAHTSLFRPVFSLGPDVCYAAKHNCGSATKQCRYQHNSHNMSLCVCSRTGYILHAAWHFHWFCKKELCFSWCVLLHIILTPFARSANTTCSTQSLTVHVCVRAVVMSADECMDIIDKERMSRDEKKAYETALQQKLVDKFVPGFPWDQYHAAARQLQVGTTASGMSKPPLCAVHGARVLES